MWWSEQSVGIIELQAKGKSQAIAKGKPPPVSGGLPFVIAL